MGISNYPTMQEYKVNVTQPNSQEPFPGFQEIALLVFLVCFLRAWVRRTLSGARIYEEVISENWG
jgi:hypothetical protein